MSKNRHPLICPVCRELIHPAQGEFCSPHCEKEDFRLWEKESNRKRKALLKELEEVHSAMKRFKDHSAELKTEGNLPGAAYVMELHASAGADCDRIETLLDSLHPNPRPYSSAVLQLSQDYRRKYWKEHGWCFNKQGYLTEYGARSIFVYENRKLYTDTAIQAKWKSLFPGNGWTKFRTFNRRIEEFDPKEILCDGR